MPARGRARACGVLPLGLVISIDIENLDPPLIQLFTAMQKRCLIRADVDITTIYKMRLHYVWPCEEGSTVGIRMALGAKPHAVVATMLNHAALGLGLADSSGWCRACAGVSHFERNRRSRCEQSRSVQPGPGISGRRRVARQLSASTPGAAG